MPDPFEFPSHSSERSELGVGRRVGASEGASNVEVVETRVELDSRDGSTKEGAVVFVVVDGRRGRDGSIKTGVEEGDGVGRGVGGGGRIVGRREDGGSSVELVEKSWDGT